MEDNISATFLTGYTMTSAPGVGCMYGLSFDNGILPINTNFIFIISWTKLKKFARSAGQAAEFLVSRARVELAASEWKYLDSRIQAASIISINVVNHNQFNHQNNVYTFTFSL